MAHTKIKDPSNNSQDILQYIKDQYSEIYREEVISLESVDAITENLLQVSQKLNKSIVKEIILENYQIINSQELIALFMSFINSQRSQ